MIISHDHKFIFIHTIKAAGWSIKGGINAFDHDAFVKSRNYPWYNCHMKPHEIMEKVGKTVWDEYFTFAFVRNPWDWLVSLYHYMMEKEGHWQHQEIAELGGFDRYIERICRGRDKGQSKFVIGKDGREIIIDFIGRFERLQEDYEKICARLEVRAIKLRKVNYSQHKDYRTYYDERLKELVAKTFAEDIERFGYEFDGPK